MQITSITNDFDIQYSPEDIYRALEHKFDDLPRGLFLTKTDDGRYYFSKEFSYALFASPFFKILGNNGILVLNALMFWSMIFMGYLYLKKENESMIALVTSTLFFILSASFVYIFWVHPEIYTMFLITAGLFIWLLYYQNQDYRYLFCASVIFGIATVAKLPIMLMFLPIIAFELYNHRKKNTLQIILLFLIPLLGFYGYFFFTTGYQSFYGGERYTYDNNFPFSNGYNSTNEPGIRAFSSGEHGRIYHLIEKIPSVLPGDTLRRFSYNIGYYFSGRFTGMVWYYPFTLLAILSMGLLFRGLMKENRKIRFIIEQVKANQDRFIILSGICLYIVAFLVLQGDNYFGGNHAVGNRYFVIYPAFLFLIKYIDFRKIIAFTIIAGILIIPVISHPIENSKYPFNTTTHFPYKFLPVEYTQMDRLPLWNNNISEDSDYRWFLIHGFLDNQNTALRIKGHSEFIVTSDSEREMIQFVLRSETDNNQISITSGNTSESVVMNSGDPIFLQISGIKPEYKDRRYHLYRLSIDTDGMTWVKPLDIDEDDYLSFDYFTGWHGEEDWNNIPSRWMSNNATLIVISDEDQIASLHLDSLSFSKDRTLKIVVNRNIVKTTIVPAWSLIHIATDITLNQGVNEIEFSIPEGCERPVDIYGSINQDRRCLSLGMQNILLDSGRN